LIDRSHLFCFVCRHAIWYLVSILWISPVLSLNFFPLFNLHMVFPGVFWFASTGNLPCILLWHIPASVVVMISFESTVLYSQRIFTTAPCFSRSFRRPLSAFLRNIRLRYRNCRLAYLDCFSAWIFCRWPTILI
jgi:hypothetical protein